MNIYSSKILYAKLAYHLRNRFVKRNFSSPFSLGRFALPHEQSDRGRAGEVLVDYEIFDCEMCCKR
jgi:hypothetical protein